MAYNRYSIVSTDECLLMSVYCYVSTLSVYCYVYTAT